MVVFLGGSITSLLRSSLLFQDLQRLNTDL